MYNREMLESMTTKQLLGVAKEFSVVGRHDMRKDQLVSAILTEQAKRGASFEQQGTSFPVNEIPYTRIQTAGRPVAIAHGLDKDMQPVSEVLFADTAEDIEQRLAAELVADDAEEAIDEEWENSCKEKENAPDGAKEPPISKNKAEYIDNAKIGTIIAFTIDRDKMLSGKIIEIHEHSLAVETKNGVKFKIRKTQVAWVRTGDRWPRGIYEALKGATRNG